MLVVQAARPVALTRVKGCEVGKVAPALPTLLAGFSTNGSIEALGYKSSSADAANNLVLNHGNHPCKKPLQCRYLSRLYAKKALQDKRLSRIDF